MTKAGLGIAGSVLAIVLCFAMLTGSTFAWFTDSSVSGLNTVQAGNLDVTVEYTLDGESWQAFDGADDLFAKGLWEPGHTEVVALRITNNGSLALKYAANMNIAKETVGKTKDGADIVLSELLTVSTLTQQANDEVGIGDITLMLAFRGEDSVAYESTLSFASANLLSKDVMLLPGAAHYLIIKVDMAATLGNAANHDGVNIPAIEFGINVLATQFSYENDTFGNGYDADAEYPVVKSETIVDSGSAAGISWSLTDAGTLTLSAAAATVPDANSGKIFAEGAWREAVVYDKNGNAVAEGYNRPNATADEGGYFCDRNAVTSLVIEEGITSIGAFAAQFPNLTGEVVIPASVTYIGQEAFQNTKITKLTFAEGGTEELCIAPGAFKSLEIEELVLPEDRPVHIHCWAFNNCKSLKKVTLPANVTAFPVWTHVEYCGMDYVWNSGRDSQIFAGCTAIESITFGSQEVHDAFFAAPGNRKNINALGSSVTIEIQ